MTDTNRDIIAETTRIAHNALDACRRNPTDHSLEAWLVHCLHNAGLLASPEHDRKIAERAWAKGHNDPQATVNPYRCPTCSPPTRETVGMVCQTCGTDYSTERGEHG